MPEKVFGIFPEQLVDEYDFLTNGFDEIHYTPHSRHTASSPEDIRKCDDLVILATSDEVGDLLVMKKDGSQIFVLGHLEYDRLTLDREYKRDLAKGLNPKIPDNYYTDNDTQIRPYLTWRATSNCLYSNWLNYFVYQITPYIL